MTSKAEGGAGTSREDGADEGRAFLIVAASVAVVAPPAWPIEAAMMSFFSIVIFVLVVAAVSIAASGAIFTVIMSDFCGETSGVLSFWLRRKRERGGSNGGQLFFLIG